MKSKPKWWKFPPRKMGVNLSDFLIMDQSAAGPPAYEQVGPLTLPDNLKSAFNPRGFDVVCGRVSAYGWHFFRDGIARATGHPQPLSWTNLRIREPHPPLPPEVIMVGNKPIARPALSIQEIKTRMRALEPGSHALIGFHGGEQHDPMIPNHVVNVSYSPSRGGDGDGVIVVDFGLGQCYPVDFLESDKYHFSLSHIAKGHQLAPLEEAPRYCKWHQYYLPTNQWCLPSLDGRDWVGVNDPRFGRKLRPDSQNDTFQYYDSESDNWFRLRNHASPPISPHDLNAQSAQSLVQVTRSDGISAGYRIPTGPSPVSSPEPYNWWYPPSSYPPSQRGAQASRSGMDSKNEGKGKQALKTEEKATSTGSSGPSGEQSAPPRKHVHTDSSRYQGGANALEGAIFTALNRKFSDFSGAHFTIQRRQYDAPESAETARQYYVTRSSKEPVVTVQFSPALADAVEQLPSSISETVTSSASSELFAEQGASSILDPRIEKGKATSPPGTAGPSERLGLFGSELFPPLPLESVKYASQVELSSSPGQDGSPDSDSSNGKEPPEIRIVPEPYWRHDSSFGSDSEARDAAMFAREPFRVRISRSSGGERGNVSPTSPADSAASAGHAERSPVPEASGADSISGEGNIRADDSNDSGSDRDEASETIADDQPQAESSRRHHHTGKAGELSRRKDRRGKPPKSKRLLEIFEKIGIGVGLRKAGGGRRR